MSVAQVAEPGRGRAPDWGAVPMEARNIEGAGKVINAFSVDVEDYFQVEAFSAVVDRLSWPSRPSRVVESTQRVLSLLETAGVRATFFVLGWVAERFPRLLGDIRSGGHEIASHGYAHELAHAQTRSQFRDDVRHAKDVIENCAGVRVRGFRAPTFSIGRENWWAYEVLAEEGYEYSSSLYPISHDLYGMPEAPRIPFRPLAGSPLLEIPIATLRLFGNNLPSGGGGYFRLAPYALSRWCIRRTNRTERIRCVFYCHPWEFDVHQPRMEGISLKARFRHYLNIGQMENRVARLLQDFAWGRMDEIYLERPQFAGESVR